MGHSTRGDAPPPFKFMNENYKFNLGIKSFNVATVTTKDWLQAAATKVPNCGLTLQTEISAFYKIKKVHLNIITIRRFLLKQLDIYCLTIGVKSSDETHDCGVVICGK